VGELPRCDWLVKKIKAVIFHNSEKILDWEKKASPHPNPLPGGEGIKMELIPFIGAMEIEKFLEKPVRQRGTDKPLVILKHGVADDRKYVTSKSQDKGEKIHLWQQHCRKELDVDFYNRLYKNLAKYKPVFKFMAAPGELQEALKGNPNFVFLKWNEMPVAEFLASGHIYLDRCSDEWRHSLPRTVCEAMSAGLPAIVEDRDGWADRIDNGDTGFLCVHYNDFQDKIDLLARKEDFRYQMGCAAREYAEKNLDPKRWVELVSRLLGD
jgi:hypothetical protein